MKNLVVGQEIWLFGVGYIQGKVVAVTPSGVDVQGYEYPALFSFDNDGEETWASRCRRLGLPPNSDTFVGTPEDCMPWELIPPDVGERLYQIRRIIGSLWGSGPITKEMWQDRNRRDAVAILENLERDIRNSG
jgi:hypothetical protein